MLLSPLLLIGPILWLIWDQSWNVPMNDEWTHVPLHAKFEAGTLGFNDFWRYQTGHRIVVTKALHLALIVLTDWHRQVMMTFNLALTVGTALLLFGGARRTLPSPRALLAVVVPGALVLFSFAAVRTWLQPFYLGFHTAAFGAALTTWALTASRVPGWRFALAILGALISTLSMSAGLAAWLAFLPAVWSHGTRRVLLWIGAALVVIIPYFIGFPLGGDEGIGTVSPLTAPLTVTKFMLAYLGAPLTGRAVGGTGRAQLFGVLGVVLVIGAAVVLLRRRDDWRRVAPWGGLALFVLGVSGVTAMGRSLLGPNTALSPRYFSISALWWITAFVLAALLATRLLLRADPRQPRIARNHQRVILGTGAVALGLVGNGLVTTNISGWTYTRTWMQPLRWNQACVLDQAHAAANCHDYYWSRQGLPEELVDHLAANQLAIFREHAPLDVTALPPLAESASGAFEKIDDQRLGRNDERVVVAPGAGRVAITGRVRAVSPDQMPGGVVIVIDDQHQRLAVMTERATEEGATTVAFEAILPTALLPPGRHTLSIRVLTNDLRAYAAVPETIEVVVGSPAAADGEPPPAAGRPSPRPAASPAASPAAVVTPAAASPVADAGDGRATRRAEHAERQRDRATRQAERGA